MVRDALLRLAEYDDLELDDHKRGYFDFSFRNLDIG